MITTTDLPLLDEEDEDAPAQYYRCISTEPIVIDELHKVANTTSNELLMWRPDDVGSVLVVAIRNRILTPTVFGVAVAQIEAIPSEYIHIRAHGYAVLSSYAAGITTLSADERLARQAAL